MARKALPRRRSQPAALIQNELSSKTMEAKAVPGLYAIGEAVDVTGWLGGYNFPVGLGQRLVRRAGRLTGSFTNL